jgi:CheY-like chemotaxis protein
MQQAALEIERRDVQDASAFAVEFQSSEEAVRMLIVDDDPAVVRLLSDRCARMGFDVATAATGMQAFLRASRTRPDVLVIDVNMPEVDGLSVCAHLLAQDRAPANVIVITGSRNPDTLNRCEGLGAYYARKGPNFWSDLEAALEEIDPSVAGKIRRAGAAEPAPADIRRRPCVLLVDDDSDINRFLGSRLQKCGIDIVCAADAYSAFRIARQSEPAVIVTDYFMPDGDGEYLLKLLRSEAATSTIPVIVLTGRQLSEPVDQRLRREIGGHPGAAHVLKKSEDNAALFETLKQFCGFEPERTTSTDIWLRSCN